MNELSQDFDCNFDNCMDKDGVRLRRRKDYIDGGLVGPSTSESVTGYGSREQWAAVGTGRCGRGWNLLNKELGARPGPSRVIWGSGWSWEVPGGAATV